MLEGLAQMRPRPRRGASPGRHHPLVRTGGARLGAGARRLAGRSSRDGRSAARHPSSAPVIVTSAVLAAPELGAPLEGRHRRRGSVAVMPFVDAATDPAGRVADGLTEDIITRLAKLRVLFVIARGTVYALRERGIGAAGGRANPERGIRGERIGATSKRPALGRRGAGGDREGAHRLDRRRSTASRTTRSRCWTPSSIGSSRRSPRRSRRRSAIARS